MKHLVIDANKGYFVRNGNRIEINQITKDDIFSLIQAIIEEDDFEMDTFNDSLLTNPAHKVIYQNLYNQLNEFHMHKDEYLEEIKATYKDAYQKYCAEIES